MLPCTIIGYTRYGLVEAKASLPEAIAAEQFRLGDANLEMSPSHYPPSVAWKRQLFMVLVKASYVICVVCQPGFWRLLYSLALDLFLYHQDVLALINQVFGAGQGSACLYVLNGSSV